MSRHEAAFWLALAAIIVSGSVVSAALHDRRQVAPTVCICADGAQ